jgi:hypothetical protein
MCQTPPPAVQPVQSANPYDDGTPLLGHADFDVVLTRQALSWW